MRHNSGFSILLKDTSACRFFFGKTGDQTADLQVGGRPLYPLSHSCSKLKHNLTVTARRTSTSQWATEIKAEKDVWIVFSAFFLLLTSDNTFHVSSFSGSGGLWTEVTRCERAGAKTIVGWLEEQRFSHNLLRKIITGFKHSDPHGRSFWSQLSRCQCSASGCFDPASANHQRWATGAYCNQMGPPRSSVPNTTGTVILAHVSYWLSCVLLISSARAHRSCTRCFVKIWGEKHCFPVN